MQITKEYISINLQINKKTFEESRAAGVKKCKILRSIELAFIIIYNRVLEIYLENPVQRGSWQMAKDLKDFL